MADIIDNTSPFTINLEIPVVPEGFASITNVIAPTEALIGQSFDISVDITNTGGEDIIFSKIIDIDTGELISEIRIILIAGQTGTFLHQGLIMPERDWNLSVDAGHETDEEELEPPTLPPTGQVIFRTNAINGNYKDSSVQIAVDTDGDGVIEAWSFSSSGSRTPRECIAYTPEGYCVFYYVGKVYVSYPDDSYASFSLGGTIPTNPEPTEPYASNGQEVYV